ncbi:hypothetical protein P7C73_g4990, partial [Tremellales sp. Uapishka_1]
MSDWRRSGDNNFSQGKSTSGNHGCTVFSIVNNGVLTFPVESSQVPTPGSIPPGMRAPSSHVQTGVQPWYRDPDSQARNGYPNSTVGPSFGFGAPTQHRPYGTQFASQRTQYRSTRSFPNGAADTGLRLRPTNTGISHNGMGPRYDLTTQSGMPRDRPVQGPRPGDQSPVSSETSASTEWADTETEETPDLESGRGTAHAANPSYLSRVPSTLADLFRGGQSLGHHLPPRSTIEDHLPSRATVATAATAMAGVAASAAAGYLARGL